MINAVKVVQAAVDASTTPHAMMLSLNAQSNISTETCVTYLNARYFATGRRCSIRFVENFQKRLFGSDQVID